MIVDVCELERILRRLRNINSIPLEEIVWTCAGKPLPVDPKILEAFLEIGLSNRDFPGFAGWLPEDLSLRVTTATLKCQTPQPT